MDAAELAADKEALGPLEVVGPIGDPWKPGPKAKFERQTWRYQFLPQDYDIGPRSDLYDPKLYREQPDAKWSAWKVRGEFGAIDDANLTVDLAWRADIEPEHPEALIPLNIFGDKEQRMALLRLGEWVAEQWHRRARPVAGGSRPAPSPAPHAPDRHRASPCGAGRDRAGAPPAG